MNYSVRELFPIQKSQHFFPEWWKALPKTYESKNNWGLKKPSATMKSCEGFLNIYKNGLILPLWSDLIVETTKDSWKYEFSASSDAVSHDPQQFGPEFNSFIHLKLISPWLIRENSGIKFIWMEPTWNHISTLGNYFTLPGIIDYKYQIGTNINLLFQQKDNKILITAGQPMAHLIPITEKEIEVRTHHVTEQEYMKLDVSAYESSFIKKYAKNKKILQGKCPFAK